MRVIIVGAGIAGLTAAHCFGRQGHDVLLIEREPSVRAAGYMIDFFGPGFDVAERLGLLDRLGAIHYPIGRIAFASAHGRVVASVAYPQLRKRLFRDRHFNFLRGDLERVLFELVDGKVIAIPDDAFLMPSGAGWSAAAYPVRGGEIATFFLYATDGWLEARTAAACQEALERHFRGRTEVVDDLLDEFPRGGDVFFDDVAQVEVGKWSRPGVTLVGDACGCVSLLGGQGASMAMAGAYILAQEITRAPGDLARSLDRYERRVRPAVQARQRAGQRNRSWFLARSDFSATVQHVLAALAVKTRAASWLGRLLGRESMLLD